MSSSNSLSSASPAIISNESGVMQEKLAIFPSQLKFNLSAGSNGAGRTVTFNIRNLDLENGLIFKIKTTAPQRYSVKPNHGKVEAGSTVSVTVTMHLRNANAPAYEETSIESLAKDKFLVQAIFIGAGSGGIGVAGIVPEENISSWWNALTPGDKSAIVEVKLRCVHEMGGAHHITPPSATNESGSLAEAPSTTSRKALRTPQTLMSGAATDGVSQATPNPRLIELEALIESLRIQLEKTEKELKGKNHELIELKSNVESGMVAEQVNAAHVTPQKYAKKGGDFAFSPVLVVLIAVFAFLVGLLFGGK